MKHFSLKLQLIIIVACGFAVFVAGLLAPKYESLGDFRFLLMIALLLVLSSTVIRAWLKHDNSSSETADASQPEGQPRLPPLLSILTNPLVITLLLAGILASRAFAPAARAMYNDEAIWNYVAHAWLRFGLPPYLGTVENKTPGIFFLFAVSNRLAGVNFWLPRLLGILSSALTCLGIYAIGRRLSGRAVGLLAMLLYGLTTASPIMDAPFTAQTETFMLAFSVLAAYLLVTTRQAASLRAHLPAIFFAGCSLGAAIAFKQTAVITAAGLFFFYLSLKAPHSRTAGAVIRDSLLFAGGVVLVTGASVVPLLMSHVSFADYLDGAWLLLRESGSSVSSLIYRLNRAMFTMESTELQCYALLIVVLLAVRKRLPGTVPLAGLLAWFAFELFAVNSSGTYWGHQLRQALPPLTLLGGMAWWALIKANFTREPAPGWPHYALIAASIALIWLPPLGWCPLSNQECAARDTYTWVRDHTTARDYVYTFGVYNANQILAYSGRRASSRYFNQYFLKSPGVEAEIRRELAEKPPAYIVIEMHRSLSLTDDLKVPTWVDTLITQSYDLEKRITYTYKTRLDDQGMDGFLIYRRIQHPLTDADHGIAPAFQKSE